MFLLANSKSISAFLALMVFVSATSFAEHGNLGEIEFPNSGAAEAQDDFIEGMLYMHNFEYQEAAAAFKRARTIDKDFAMAYWGEALTYHHPLWNQQARTEARDLLRKLGRTSKKRAAKVDTQRERDYLGAIEILYGMTDETEALPKDARDDLYRDAMRRILETYPDDHEARTLYGLSILGSGSRDRNFTTYMQAAAVLTETWDANRKHPGAAHYLIHAYDDPTHAPLGLPMARAYSKIAPGAAHAQHMTSHIFVSLGMWDDLVDSNETAVHVENISRDTDGGRPIAATHYVLWLQYGYLQQGRINDAAHLMQNALDRLHDDPKSGEKAYYGTMYARYILDTEDWDAAEKWKAPDEDTMATPNYHFARAYALIKNGDLEEAQLAMDRVVPAKGGSPEAYADEETVGVLRLELDALMAVAKGESEQGIAIARKAVEAQEALKFNFGPPHVVKPAIELLGDLLLVNGQYEDALTAYSDQIAETPRRTNALIGQVRAATESGNELVATDARNQLEKIWHNADAELPQWTALTD